MRTGLPTWTRARSGMATAAATCSLDGSMTRRMTSAAPASTRSPGLWLRFAIDSGKRSAHDRARLRAATRCASRSAPASGRPAPRRARAWRLRGPSARPRRARPVSSAASPMPARFPLAPVPPAPRPAGWTGRSRGGDLEPHQQVAAPDAFAFRFRQFGDSAGFGRRDSEVGAGRGGDGSGRGHDVFYRPGVTVTVVTAGAAVVSISSAGWRPHPAHQEERGRRARARFERTVLI